MIRTDGRPTIAWSDGPPKKQKPVIWADLPARRDTDGVVITTDNDDRFPMTGTGSDGHRYRRALDMRTGLWVWRADDGGEVTEK
ncbi:MAG TPA: hypothetical protein VIV12_30120 [Streptosporangiaceae bacterium]